MLRFCEWSRKLLFEIFGRPMLKCVIKRHFLGIKLLKSPEVLLNFGNGQKLVQPSQNKWKIWKTKFLLPCARDIQFWISSTPPSNTPKSRIILPFSDRFCLYWFLSKEKQLSVGLKQVWWSFQTLTWSKNKFCRVVDFVSQSIKAKSALRKSKSWDYKNKLHKNSEKIERFQLLTGCPVELSKTQYGTRS